LNSIQNSFTKIKFRMEKSINGLFNNIFWHLTESNFDFYLDGHLLDSNYCNDTLRSQAFNYFREFHYILLMDSVSYERKICPLVFMNTKIIFLSFQHIRNTFINRNMPTFLNSSLISQKSINVTIYSIRVVGYRIDLNMQFLNRMVFKNLENFEFLGQLDSIESDLFKQFSKLKILRLVVQKLDALFHRDLKWISSLNEKTLINLNSPDPIIIYLNNEINFMILIFHQSFPNITLYKYPDEDICLFKEYPHNHLVLPQLTPSALFDCTCTQLFLIQYANGYVSLIDSYTKEYYSDYFYFVKNVQYHEYHLHSTCFQNKSFREAINSCNFSARFKLCQLTETKSVAASGLYMYTYDWVYSLKVMNIFINVFLMPILCFICILAYTLIIYVIKKENKKKEKFYEYLTVMCVCNLILCFIMPFQLFSFCLISIQFTAHPFTNQSTLNTYT